MQFILAGGLAVSIRAEHELKTNKMSDLLVSGVLYPMEQIIKNNDGEERKTIKACRFTIRTGWSLQDVVFLDQGGGSWYVLWRSGTHGNDVTTGYASTTSFMNRFKSPAARKLFAALEKLNDWHAATEPKVSMDDGLTVLCAKWEGEGKTTTIFKEISESEGSPEFLADDKRLGHLYGLATEFWKIVMQNQINPRNKQQR